MKHRAKDVVIVLSLAAAGFFAGWLHLRSRLAGAGSLSDGHDRYRSETAEPIRYAVWDEARPLSGPIDTRSRESAPALSPDGGSLVFVVGERGSDAELWIADVAGDGFLDPRPITALASGSDELSPAFSDHALWFASDRPGGAGGLDLWRAPWRDGAFGPPLRVASGVNGPADDRDPAPARDETTLVFASDRDGAARGFDLHQALDPLSAACAVEPLAALSSGADEREPALANDGASLYFASNRAGGEGGFDLYESRLHEGAWLEPRPLARINGPSDERGPAPAADGFTLLFERAGGGSSEELFRARSLELYRLPGIPIGWVEWLTLASLFLLALLAALAKRWPAIDTLYKCFLASVIVHLLLLWWLRDVRLEGGATPGARPDRHRVRLLRETLASQKERAGELEVARSELALPAETPERAAIDAEALAAREALPRASGAALEAPEAELASPERGAAQAEPAASSAAPEVAVEVPAEALERRAGAAPSLAVDADATPAARASAAEAIERASTLADPLVAGASTPAASSAPLQASARREDASSPTRMPLAGLDLGRESREAGSVPIELPREELATRGGGAPELLLEAAATGAARTDEQRAPERAAASISERARDARDEAPASSGARVAAPLADAPAPVPRATSESGPERLALPARGVELADREPRPAPLGGSPASSRTGGEETWLSSLLPDPSTRRRADERAAGEAREPERQEIATPRAREEPPRPREAEPLAAAAPLEREPLPLERRSWDHTPYQNRAGPEKARAIELYGGNAETERAVADGLRYLARIQRPGGNWGRTEAFDGKYGVVAIGKTGLCLLAFLGAGHTPDSGTEHSDNAARAVAFLLGAQDEESGHFGESEAYGHGIATYAIGECYALTRDPALRAPLEAAVAHVLAAQSDRRDPRFYGGWGYFYPGERVYDAWPRTSITAWQVMALESARLSGLAVPDAAFDGARAFLLGARDEEQGWIRYNHDPARLGSGYPTLPASTPAGLFALSLLGEDLASGDFAELLRFVEKRKPSGYRFAGEDAFVERAAGNLYFWYYGTLATFRAGGGAWQSWNEAMKSTLLPAQQQNGSWKPIDVYARYARDDDHDRSYTTAMCVLSLEVYYRYFLPLLQVR